VAVVAMDEEEAASQHKYRQTFFLLFHTNVIALKNRIFCGENR